MKNLHEFLQIHDNQNENIILLEASIIVSVTFLVDTFEDTLLFLQDLLTDWDERPRTLRYLSLKTLLACS